MEPKVEFITGRAGTGKTYELKSRIKIREPITNRYYGTLCATTGIAAVNLSGGNGDSVTTLNSELKFFDTESLKETYASGKLQRSLLKVMNKGANLCIDEISMMEAEQLDILYLALTDINSLSTVQDRGGFGMVLSGDFCQLAPVKGKYAFEAQCWEKFAESTTRLTKVYRQENLEFLAAVNAAREGDGDSCADLLKCLEDKIDGFQNYRTTKIFHDSLDLKFDGTTIMAKNVEVDRFNEVRLLELLSSNKKITYKSKRWGQQRGEWKIIPDELVLTENAYVMILANNPPDFDYANGDCGYILEAKEQNGIAYVKLKRNDKEVKVTQVTRKIMQKETPEGESEPDPWLDKGEWRKSRNGLTEAGDYLTSDIVDSEYDRYLDQLTLSHKKPGSTCYFDYKEKKWVMGGITYMPLRLAYASTCHKTQGLTLDSVQIDPHNRFFGQGSMLYVALSRVRSHEGLRIVGSPKLLAERTNICGEVLKWI